MPPHLGDLNDEPAPRWADELIALLSRKPTPLADLVAALSAQFPWATADKVEAWLADEPSAYEGEDGWVDLVKLADGAVLTHVVTATEATHQVLAAEADLALWGRIALDGRPFGGGGTIRLVETHHVDFPACSVLTGPGGWLDGVEPLSIIGLRLRSGTLHVEPAAAGPVPDATGERAVTFVSHATEMAKIGLLGYLDLPRPRSAQLRAPGLPLDVVTAEVLLAEPELLADPMPPLGVLLSMTGLELYHGAVGLPGVPWSPDDADLPERTIWARIKACSTILSLERGEEVDQAILVDVLDDMSQPDVLDTLGERLERWEFSTRAIERLQEVATTPRHHASLAFLSARYEEGAGHPEAAERLVAQALRANPRLIPALVDAADYAATRGDVLAAELHLRRAGVPSTHPLRTALAVLRALPVLSGDRATDPSSAPGRNRPCPCGSGRKYKVCCLPKQRHPLSARAPLAYTRLVHWLFRASNAELVDEFVGLVDSDEPEASVVVADLALFDGGGLDDYLDERGSMLPADERELLEAWRSARVLAYEVSAVRPGESLTLRSLLDDEPDDEPDSEPGAPAAVERGVLTLPDAALSAVVKRLDVLLVRLLHDGSELRLIAPPVLVPRSRRRELMAIFDDYSPYALAAFFGPPPPVTLTNNDGDPLVVARAEYEVDEVDDATAWQRLAAALGDERGDRTDQSDRLDPPDRLDWTRESAYGTTVLGWVTRHGRVWTLETNSERRLNDLHGLLMETVPGAVELDRTMVPAWDEIARRTEGRGDGDPMDPDGGDDFPGTDEQLAAAGDDEDELSDDDAREALDVLVRRYEQDWVDQPLPALDGLTPREALAQGGSAGRELLALLNDIEWSDNGSMNADRLRELLGLPPTEPGPDEST